MADLLESLRQSFADPITRHAMLVHFPIALGLFAIPFVAALPFIRKRPAIAYRVLLATILFGVGVIAWQGSEAGEAAETIVEARLPDQNARDVLKRHAVQGERIPLLLAGTSLLVFATLVPRRGVRLASGLLATAAMITTAVVITLAAHDGGRLVHHLDRPPAFRPLN